MFYTQSSWAQAFLPYLIKK